MRKIKLKHCTILYAFVFISLHASAQKSVFQQDTVVFKYYTTGAKDEVENRGRGGFDDTIRDLRRVYMDKNRIVHWIEHPMSDAHGARVHILERAGLIHSSDININTKMFDTLIQLPQFRVVRNGTSFSYETIGAKRKTIFRASFNRKDGIVKTPFFLAWSVIRGVPRESEFEHMSYAGDTTLHLGSKTIKCHLFTKFLSNFTTSRGAFGTTFTEIYFEQSSLLPVYISRRSMSRGPGDSDVPGKTEYYLLYFFSRIEPF